MQIKPDQQHLGQPFAELTVFGRIRKRELLGSKKQIVFDEFHHLLS